MIVVVGLVAGRRVKKTDDYFLGHRGFSVWLVIAQAFGVGTHAEMPVSLAGKVYSSGYAGIWYQWKNLFITPFYWLLAPLFRRFRRTTTGEVYEDRYGNFMGAVYTVFALSYFVFNMGAMLKGAGKLVSVAMGEPVSPNTVVLVMTVTFLVYSFVGGLVAAAWTDFVQSFFIIALSFLLIPLGLGVDRRLQRPSRNSATGNAFDGDAGRRRRVHDRDADPQRADRHRGAAAHSGQRRARATTRTVAAWGMAAGNFIKRFCTIGWALVGLIVAAMLVQRGAAPFADPEEAFGYATRELLFPGAVGLDDRLRARRQHVDRFGLYRRRRRFVHPEFLPPLPGSATERPPLPAGRPSRRRAGDDLPACCSGST